MDNMSQIVEREMEKYKQKYGNMAINYYLNNFHLNLPDGRFRNGGWKRSHYNDEQWTKKFREFNNDEDFSNLYKNQSPKEFYEIIDKTIIECGLDIEEIKKLQKNGEIDVLRNLVFLVYVRLRELGYKRYPDLVQ